MYVENDNEFLKIFIYYNKSYFSFRKLSFEFRILVLSLVKENIS